MGQPAYAGIGSGTACRQIYFAEWLPIGLTKVRACPYAAPPFGMRNCIRRDSLKDGYMHLLPPDRRCGWFRRIIPTQIYPVAPRRFELAAGSSAVPTSTYRPPSSYAIFRRLNTGTLAKSRITAKIAAATSIPPTTNTGRGVMAMPRVTNVEMIRTSQIVDTMTQRLG
jgi:hypothetical protein